MKPFWQQMEDEADEFHTKMPIGIVWIFVGLFLFSSLLAVLLSC